MLDISNSTLFTDLEHNACTITLLVIHTTLLLWTLFSCTGISIMVHLLPSLQSLHHMILGQYSIIGYFTALFCVLMSTIDAIMLGEWRLGPVTCNIWYTVDIVLNTTSAWLSATLMLERLLCIAAPQYSLNLSKRCKVMVILSPWVLSLVVTFLGIGLLQHGEFHNFVTNNSTSIDQCYFVEPNNRMAIYSTAGSFLLPYAVTLCLFITIKYTAAFKQTRLTLSKSRESISDVLLDSDPDESINSPPRLPEHNYTSTPEDTLRRGDFSMDTGHPDNQPKDMYGKTSSNGQGYSRKADTRRKKEIPSPREYLNCKECPSRASNWTQHPTSRTRVIEYPHESYGANSSSDTSDLAIKRTKQGLPERHMPGKSRHLNPHRDRKNRPLPFPNRNRRPQQYLDTSTPSAYLTALHKAKHQQRMKQAYEQMTSNEAIPDGQHHSSRSLSSGERIEHIYVNKHCVRTEGQESRGNLCSLHGKHGESVTWTGDGEGDTSSSDSESSHGLIHDKTVTAGPKKEHIVMTNVLRGENLRTVYHTGLVIFLYSLFWLPFHVLRLLLRFSPQLTIHHNVYTAVHLLGYFSSGVCPWMYYVLQGYINSSTWSNMKYRFINPSQSDLSSTSSI